MTACSSKGRILSAHRSDLRVPAGFKENANEVPDCDRSLFKKVHSPVPWGLVCCKRGINESATVLHKTLCSVQRHPAEIQEEEGGAGGGGVGRGRRM